MYIVLVLQIIIRAFKSRHVGKRQEAEQRNKPVWVRACRCSSSLRVNRFPHKTQLQAKGRSPVCRRTWARSREVLRKVFPHSGTWQMCLFFPWSPSLEGKKSLIGQVNEDTRVIFDNHPEHFRERLWGSDSVLSSPEKIQDAAPLLPVQKVARNLP